MLDRLRLRRTSEAGYQVGREDENVTFVTETVRFSPFKVQHFRLTRHDRITHIARTTISQPAGHLRRTMSGFRTPKGRTCRRRGLRADTRRSTIAPRSSRSPLPPLSTGPPRPRPRQRHRRPALNRPIPIVRRGESHAVPSPRPSPLPPDRSIEAQPYAPSPSKPALLILPSMLAPAQSTARSTQA